MRTTTKTMTRNPVSTGGVPQQRAATRSDPASKRIAVPFKTTTKGANRI